MILQRISKNVISQNWFTVVVEFVIVVVGVFMGLQVQDWNEARKARIEEAGLLSRLHMETRELLETQREELMGLRERADVLMGVNPVLFSQEPLRVITHLECARIVASHVFRRPPDELPVLDEMLSTGRFDILQEPNRINDPVYRTASRTFGTTRVRVISKARRCIDRLKSQSDSRPSSTMSFNFT